MLLALVAGLICLAVPSLATAQPCPPFDGGMGFPAILGPEDPEEFCWEVNLSEEQELVQIDDRTVQVFISGGFPSFTISATKAHDAEGTTVPTTLAKTGRNLITLTVHHRAGNPAAGGAPFVYPISQGEGWEGGFQTATVTMPPPTEQETNPPISPPAPTCEVPSLQGRTLKAAKRALRRAGCVLGPVRNHGATVVKQYRPAYRVLPAGSAVGVRLGR